MPKAKAKFSGRLQMQEIDVHLNEGTVQWNGSVDSSNYTWDPPISGTVYGTLLNYQGALDQMEDALHQDPYKSPPKAPILYIKPKNTITGNQTVIPMPEDVSELEVGACLGLVIGEKASRVSEDEAMSYIEGYTIVNDISVPHESVFRPAVKHKSRDGFCPAGPWIVERDDVPTPDNLTIRVYVNGECKQENHTGNLVRSVAQLLSDVTEFMTLEKGDTLLVGIPENPPRVKDGDQIRIDIEQVGVLENKVKKEAAVGGIRL
ncbi:5-carboxy-2-oxohept-3-enedioate decarboxylase HpaG1 subunit [Halobacillus alkaliphilus]|uniref:5-carboxy-2-oxohept-3-enedioate decarboxylase HpaG1 subunit n=1 Tax=Halobacillus alkaliphilus TaxID=396056 RepID=A0A1I2L3G7_9BACI|nr:fumarylacetoacetate hydrolase family protein [Halobacillus alkaliphilus]SFF73020.1 5-carboxy-2-oxohept-3-enedioate decarboxylase HpaG1 subunit [Halobacillus alkaliphilus]